MPDLPVDQQNVSPQATPVAPVQDALTPSALGADLGAAMENAGEVATRVHHDAVAHFNDTMVLDAHNQLQQGNQKAVFDPQTGILNKNTGINAPQAVDATLSDYDKRSAQISSTLANDQQRESFARISQDTRYQLQDHLDGYESRQVKTYQNKVTDATVSNALTSAVQNVGAVAGSPDPRLQSGDQRAAALAGAGNDSLALGVAAIKDAGSRNADPPQDTANKIAQFQSTGHYGVIQSLLSQGRDQDASAYYSAHKDQLQGEQADMAARGVQAGSTAGDAQRLAPSFVFDAKGQQKDLADIYPAMRADSRLANNPKLYEATRAQVNQILGENARIKDQQQDRAFDATYGLMTALPNGIHDPVIQAQIAQMDPQHARWMTAAGEKDLELRQQGKEVPDFSDTYLKFLAAATSADPEDRAAVANSNPRSIQGEVSPRDFPHVVATWERLRGLQAKSSGTDDTPDATQGVLTGAQIANTTLQANGFKEKLTDGTTNPDWLNFQRSFNEAVAAAGGPKALGADGMQKQADYLMVQHWDTKTRSVANPVRWTGDATYQAPGQRRFQALGQDFRYGPSQITPLERSSVLASLRARGVANPSPQMIYNAYLYQHPAALPWWDNKPQQ